MEYIADVYVWVAVRLSLGSIFLWAFVDKLFGFGFATQPEQAWIHGGSPTAGFLKFGVSGPFSSFFNALSGSVFVDWLFMLGLLGIGLSLILGVCTKIAGWSGAFMVLLMWLALLPPKNNPVIDEHVVYLILLIGIAAAELRAGDYYGLGKWWKKRSIIKKYPILE